MKLMYLLFRPLTRRSTSLISLFTIMSMFYTYHWVISSLDQQGASLEKRHMDNPQVVKRPAPQARKKKPWFWSVLGEGEIIKPQKYKNTQYDIYPAMLLDRQGIKYFHENLTNGVWPDPAIDWDDRITAQMVHIPEAAKVEQKKPFDQQNLKTVVFWKSAGVIEGRQKLLDDQCPVTQCYFSRNRRLADQADAVVFNNVVPKGLYKRKGQIWVYFALESPWYTPPLRHANGLVNWTATYRSDSVIVTPYEKYMPYNLGVTALPPKKNYATGKTKLVAWFVSNCAAKSGRGVVARELAKYVQVDIYGRCGPHSCAKTDKKCFKMLNKDYKFYLSFENSNCKDYITEKFFLNGMQQDIVPIVFGASRADYEKAVPRNSFIHVSDFRSIRELADYLRRLDKNDALYNEYFKWKGTGKFVNTFFYCRLCAMLWDQTRDMWYQDFEGWWRGKGICRARRGLSARDLVHDVIAKK